MKGVTSDVAAKAIAFACAKKFHKENDEVIESKITHFKFNRSSFENYVPWILIISHEKWATLTSEEKTKVKRGWFQEYVESRDDYKDLPFEEQDKIKSNFLNK